MKFIKENQTLFILMTLSLVMVIFPELALCKAVPVSEPPKGELNILTNPMTQMIIQVVLYGFAGWKTIVYFIEWKAESGLISIFPLALYIFVAFQWLTIMKMFHFIN